MRVSDEMRSLLGFAYNLRAIAGYETGPDFTVSPKMATDASEKAKPFVVKIVELLDGAWLNILCDMIETATRR